MTSSHRVPASVVRAAQRQSASPGPGGSLAREIDRYLELAAGTRSSDAAEERTATEQAQIDTYVAQYVSPSRDAGSGRSMTVEQHVRHYATLAAQLGVG